MKAYEILTLAQPMIEKLLSADINPRDVQYLEVYHEYKRLRDEGHKLSWIQSVLADEFGVSERTIRYVVKRFETDLF